MKDPGLVAEQQTINAFILVLEPLQKNTWYRQFATDIPPPAIIEIIGASGGVLCRVHLSGRTVASNCGRTEQGLPPTASLTREQSMQLRALVGGTWEVK